VERKEGKRKNEEINKEGRKERKQKRK